MRLARAARRRPIGITSLIDVIFLLLLFFMLASSFSRYQALPVSSGASGAGSADRPMLLRVHDDARWDLNGLPVTAASIAERLQELSQGAQKTVAIWSGETATTQNLVDALVAIRAAGHDAVVITGR